MGGIKNHAMRLLETSEAFLGGRKYPGVLINGKWEDAQRSSPSQNQQNILPIINPTTGKVLFESLACSENTVDLAVSAAKKAQRAWWKVPGAEKANLMHLLATRTKARTKDLASAMTLDTGKPYIEAVDCIEWVAACFDYYAETARASYGVSIPPVAPHQFNYTVKEPYGVVAAIVPFNFPLLLMSWKVAPAIAAGNTIVLKAPHQNPFSNLIMAEIFNECLPAGVVNVITGGSTGELLVKHRDVDLIAFTGSTPVGRKIASLAGSHLKKVNLELGGIDPLLVFSDADLEVAARGASWARLLNAGQVCTSSKRIYVVKKVYDEFLERVIKNVESLTLGCPFENDTDIGPMISSGARQNVLKQVERLQAEGAKRILGKNLLDKDALNKLDPEFKAGSFCNPYIFSEVKHGGLATTEEIFGPVMNIIKVADENEAIEKANDSQYGLGATVYTKSLEWAMRASEFIKAGTFWINDPLTDNDAGPFGGMRFSGMGRELGEEGLNAFREPKHVHLDYVQEVKPFWFPYKNREVSHHG